MGSLEQRLEISTLNGNQELLLCKNLPSLKIVLKQVEDGEEIEVIEPKEGSIQLATKKIESARDSRCV